MTDPPPSPGSRSPRPWRAYFDQGTAAIFVVSGSRRLRYANPAWEKLTGHALSRMRGTKFSATRQSASPLWKTLAPPPEVWLGQPARIRRSAPAAQAGPPWWDITFVPLPGDERLVGVIGMVMVVGKAARGAAFKVPAVLGELRQRHAERFSYDLIDGPTPGTQRLLAQARLAVQSTAPVWLVGEPGSGKETLARVIHHNGITRERAFIGLDCRGLQPYLIESLLTGRGGLTGSNQVGTLYLKEPGALPRDLQERMAAPFVSGTLAGTRLICGATATAAEELRAGRLVPVFHTTLSVLELRTLPLQERPEDLPRLVEHLLERSESTTMLKHRLADAVWPVLQAHRWSGNIRELAAALVVAVTKSGAELIDVEHLPRSVRVAYAAGSAPPPRPAPAWTLDAVLESVERRLIVLALRRCGNSQTEAAEQLGVFRARLARRIESLGISPSPRAARPRTGRDAGRTEN